MMNILLLAGGIMAALAQTDTTFAVRAGARLELDAMSGSAVVSTWDRDAVRVQAEHRDGVSVRIRQTAGRVLVEPVAQRGGTPQVRFEITVPRTFDVVVDGLNLSVRIQGVQGSVAVDNVEGDVTIRDVTGNVQVESISGTVIIDNVHGGVRAGSVNQQLRMTRITGDIVAETTNGSIAVTGAASSLVDLSTVNGRISYDGTVRNGGRYTLHTHNGEIAMSIPADANATLRVTARNGRIHTAFPLAATTATGSRIAATLGTGSAQIDLQSYNGSISLTRPRAR